MAFDLVVQGGSVIDGTGARRFRADVGVAGGRIAAVARNGTPLPARSRIDATDRVVAPGFIDGNSHVDWMAPLAGADDLLASFLLQGITTSVGGGCGYSPTPVPADGAAGLDRLTAFLHDGPFPYAWNSLGEFLAVLEARRPPLNLAFLVGQNTIRQHVLGLGPRAPGARELARMRDLIRDALDEGALGLSGNAGMRPGRFARGDELVALARVAADAGGVCAVHARAYTAVSDAYGPFGPPHNVRAVRDLVDLGRRSGARVQISHLLFAGRRTWRTAGQVLAEIDEACAAGVDIAFDAVPYTVGAGPIELLFPGWFIERFPASASRRAGTLRLKAELTAQRALVGIDYDDLCVMASDAPALAPVEGKSFAAIARESGDAPIDAEIRVARDSGLATMVLFGCCSGDDGDDEPLRQVLRHPRCAVITNAAVRAHGAPNPAAFGAFPRVLGRFSRDLGLFSLEEAVRRMTGYPAERLGLTGVGRIAEGLAADLVVFDPRTVGVRDDANGGPGGPTGIDAVVVSGEVAVADGAVVPGPGHGRILR